MVALDSLESANFMYLCEITDATRGNLSVQIKTLYLYFGSGTSGTRTARPADGRFNDPE